MSIKLEIGKTYISRDRKWQVKIVSFSCSDTYPFWGDDGHCYREDGSWYWKTPNNHDLVEEITTKGHEMNIR